MREALIAHPGLAAASLADRPRTEATFRLLENLLGILLAGQIDAQDAAWTADIIAALVTHAAIELELRGAQITDDAAVDIRVDIDRLPADQFPLLRAHTDQLVSGDVEQRFRFAIDVVLDGVTTRAGKPSPAVRRGAPSRRATRSD